MAFKIVTTCLFALTMVLYLRLFIRAQILYYRHGRTSEVDRLIRKGRRIFFSGMALLIVLFLAYGILGGFDQP